MVAHPEMPPPPLGERDARDIYGRPPQGAHSVHMIARLHPAEAQPARRADTAGPGPENDEIGLEKAAAGSQGRVDIDRFKGPAEGMSAGDRTAEQALFLQPGDISAES